MTSLNSRMTCFAYQSIILSPALSLCYESISKPTT